MGKTVQALNALIKAAMENDKPNPRYAYIAPTYSQAKRVAWDYLTNFVRPLDATANIAELRVDFFGRRIQLYGSDNPDSLRGQYFDGSVLDEIGDQIAKGFVCLLAHQRETITSRTCSTEQGKKKDGVHYSSRQAKQS
jgi:hypothetical protein